MADESGQFNNRVALSGDWKRARRTFDGLGFKMHKASARTMREDAELAAERIRKGLKNQTYKSLHAPLAQSTIANKKNPENADKILVDTEEFMNAIAVHQTGPLTYLVGVQGNDDLVRRASANEWGATGKWFQHIPARPVFRLEIERVKATGLVRLRSAFNRILSGRLF